MLSKAITSTIFWVFSMTWLGIKPQSPGQLVNTVLFRPANTLKNILYAVLKLTEFGPLIYQMQKLVKSYFSVWVKCIFFTSTEESSTRIIQKVQNLTKKTKSKTEHSCCDDVRWLLIKLETSELIFLVL